MNRHPSHCEPHGAISAISAMGRIAQRVRRVAGIALLAGVSQLASSPAGAQGLPAGTESDLTLQLDALVRRAFDHPEAVLDELQARRPEPASPDDPRLAPWLFAQGRTLIMAGRAEAAEAVAVQLLALPGRGQAVDLGWLLRALARERAGAATGSLAARALEGIERRCPTASSALAPAALAGSAGACDFRYTWEALRLVARDQLSQGAYITAEGTFRRMLALARAGSDRHLTVLSRGMLTRTLVAPDQLEAARAEIRASQTEAQGDPIATARFHFYAANVERGTGDFAAARTHLEAGALLADQADAPHVAAQLRANLMDAYMHSGSPQLALALGRRVIPVLQRYGELTYERGMHHNLAVTHIQLRQFDAARQELARVAEFPVDPAYLAPRARELRELAEAWAQAGQYKEALAAYHAEYELNARVNERNRETALEELRRKYDSGARQRDLALLARDGQLKDQQLANRRLAQEVGIAVGVLLLLSLVLVGVTLVRMRRAQSRLTANQLLLRAQSERDPLTDLSNRRHFLAVMDQRAREAGSEGFSGALMMIDIDHFKNINDRHGHAAGDTVIVEVGQRIREAVREADLVVRWGGEEFLVLAASTAGRDLAQMADRVLHSIGGTPIDTDGGALRVSASIGFASFPVAGVQAGGLRLHWEQAVNWADMVLYKAKADGRNRAVGIEQVEAPSADALAAILQDFDAACIAGQVRLLTRLGPT